MNYLSFLIVFFLLFQFILRMWADVLVLKTAPEKVPSELEGYWDGAAYAKAGSYYRARTCFSWANGAFDLLILLGFWFAGGFPFLDGWVREEISSPVLSGMGFIGILMMGKWILNLPFEAGSVFGIEQRFGFNRTDVKTWVLDQLKGLAIAIVLGGVLLWAVLAFFHVLPPQKAWWLCWLAVCLFILFVQWAYPAWIMPLFNRFEPLSDPDLKDRILAVADKMAVSVENIYVMDGSKRSEKSNAFFAGFGKKRKIVLFDTLIARHTPEELVAVLAHELAHYHLGHIRRGMILSMAWAGIMLFLFSRILHWPDLFAAFGMEGASIHGGLVFFGLLFAPADFFISIFFNAVSRRHEFQADRLAVSAVQDPGPLITALKKLSANNLSFPHAHKLHTVLNHSHPPLLARIRVLSSKKSQNPG